MQTPTAALAWELWRRNRLGFIGMFSMFLGFAFIYPKLCAMAGVDLGNSDDLVSFGASAMKSGPRSQFVATMQVLYIIFLAGSPLAALFLSLLCLTWMFTFVEFHPNDKNPVRFPDRLFMLPISNSFLFSLLLGGGVAALASLFGCWHFFVPMPHALQAGVYQKCFSWLTFLALAQGITWALAGWPNTRLCVLLLVLSTFLLSPAWQRFVEPRILMPVLFFWARSWRASGWKRCGMVNGRDGLGPGRFKRSWHGCRSKAQGTFPLRPKPNYGLNGAAWRALCRSL